MNPNTEFERFTQRVYQKLVNNDILKPTMVQFGDTAINIGVEFGTFHLIDDRSVVRFVYGKDISALGAFELSHVKIKTATMWDFFEKQMPLNVLQRHFFEVLRGKQYPKPALRCAPHSAYAP